MTELKKFRVLVQVLGTKVPSSIGYGEPTVDLPGTGACLFLCVLDVAVRGCMRPWPRAAALWPVVHLSGCETPIYHGTSGMSFYTCENIKKFRPILATYSFYQVRRFIIPS